MAHAIAPVQCYQWRFVISDIKADSVSFEHAFSDDYGKTWEVNWITTDTRIPERDRAATKFDLCGKHNLNSKL